MSHSHSFTVATELCGVNMSSAGVEIPRDVKQEARDSRLSVKNSEESDLRKLLLHEARKLCKEEVSAFAECAKDKGLFVVFQCRQHNKASKAI